MKTKWLGYPQPKVALSDRFNMDVIKKIPTQNFNLKSESIGVVIQRVELPFGRNIDWLKLVFQSPNPPKHTQYRGENYENGKMRSL